MVHLYCKSAPALTFENLLQDICQEACDAVHRFSKVPSLVTLLHTLRNTLFTTLSLLHSLRNTLFTTLSLPHSVCYTLFTTLSLLHTLYYTLFATPLHYTPTRGAQILKSTLLVTLYGKNTRALTF
jgi:hypothetical protein